MVTNVGFLRAINLGATRKFPKEAIVAATEAAGFTGVATHINTGNVRFDTTMRSRARIEAALERAYEDSQGFAVPTIVFTPAELRSIAADAERFGAAHEGRHYVSLLKVAPTPETARQLEARSSEQARVHVVGRAVHLLLAGDYHQASMSNTAVEKVLGVATNRNLTVIRALVQKWC
ncbi:MAG: DUF1697 domain-containing protein [Nocardioides sp.]|nr:DUF1697 domain-containing protein [Nocardioides sp.]